MNAAKQITDKALKTFSTLCFVFGFLWFDMTYGFWENGRLTSEACLLLTLPVFPFAVWIFRIDYLAKRGRYDTSKLPFIFQDPDDKPVDSNSKDA